MNPARHLTCTLLFAALAATAVAQESTSGAAADKTQYDQPSQPLGEALKEFGRTSGLTVVVDSALARGITAPGLRGLYTPAEALDLILATTGLRAEYLDARTVAIRAARGGSSSAVGAPPRQPLDDAQRMALARVEQTSASQRDRGKVEDPKRASGESNPQGVEEIIVTAQKRTERLQDVPVPVSSINADVLVGKAQVRLQDYYNQIPGLSLTMLGDTATPVVAIRGVTTGGYTNPTVAIVVDDVPFGASTLATGGSLAPDPDPSEVERIEVLRGPQGALYGASSLGGLIKYVTVSPSTSALSGSVQAGLSSVSHGDGIGYNVRGAINVPVTDTFALRASGFTREEPGYIDNPVLGIDGVNSRSASGGRLAGLWQPTDALTVKVSALLQDLKRDGEDAAFRLATLGDLEQTAVPSTGRYGEKIQAYSATVNGKWGRAELTSVSGYSINEGTASADYTPVLGSLSQAIFHVAGMDSISDWRTSKYSQEVRVSMPLGSRVSWLSGVFYSHENYRIAANIRAVDASTDAVAGSWLEQLSRTSFSESALFTALTFQVTDRFDIQVGGREGRVKLESGESSSFGPWNMVLLGLPSQFSVSRPFESTDDAFTYLVTPRFKVSSDLMLYARAASGFRPGGPNESVLAQSLGLPRAYEPDTTRNYEIGAKGAVFNGGLSFDASVYHVDWRDLQLQLRDPTTFQTYYVNAGRARSRGVELSLASRPFHGFRATLWTAWNDAELTEDFPVTSTTTGRSGDRLPYGPRWSGSLSLDQDFPLADRVAGFVGTSFTYVGDRMGRFFQGVLPREEFPSYTQLDLRAGARFGDWTVNAFANNVADQRGILRGGRDASLSLRYAFNYIQPRTIGLSIERSF